jgi:hypothetical protein
MKNRALVFGAVLPLVLAAGIAVAAAAPDRRGVIHGCRDTDTGTLRVIDDNSSCGPKEESLDWNTAAQASRRWYADRDGDNFGDWYDHLDSPVQPPGYVDNNTDCNDDRRDVNPGTGVSIGKGQDFDCDGIANERGITWYRDADGDGWGEWTRNLTGDRSTRPSGYVLYVPDCDDNDPEVTFGCYEKYQRQSRGFDQDGDGHRLMGVGDDCNDSNADVYPGKTEIRYDGLDNDCGGQPDSIDTTPDIECYVADVGRHDPVNWGWRVPNSNTACNALIKEPSKNKLAPRPSPAPARPEPKK